MLYSALKLLKTKEKKNKNCHLVDKNWTCIFKPDKPLSEKKPLTKSRTKVNLNRVPLSVLLRDQIR